MAGSKATTVDEYLEELPEERRAVLSAVRKQILENLPQGYRETMNWGMISYEVPLERYPDTYNGQPLSYAGLAAQKNGYALHLMAFYMDPEKQKWVEEEFRKAGKKLDMGKNCLRFRRLEDLPAGVVAGAVSGTPVDEFVAAAEAARKRPARKG